MKKKIKALMVLVVMLISVLGSMSVSAEVITVQDFDSAYEEAFYHGYTARVDDGIGYKLELGQTYTFPLCVNYYSDPLYPDVSSVIDRLTTSTFTLKSADNSVYCVFLRSERDLIPVIFSTGNFYIEYLFADEFKTIVDESGTSYLHDNGLSSAQNFFELKQYGNYYYASLYSGLFGLWNDYMQVSLPTYDVDGGKTSVGVIFKSFIDKYIDGSLNPPVVRGENGEDILVSDIENQFDESTATYEPELGYLKNVKGYGLYENKFDESNSNFLPTTGSGSLKFVWDSSSTTGVDLNNENIYVRFFTSAGAVGAATNTPNTQLITDSERNFYQKYPAGDCSILMSLDEFHSISQSDYEKWYDAQSFWDKNTKGIVRRDTVYLQLTKQNADGSWSYGGYVKISYGRDKVAIDVQSTFPNGEKDESSPTNGKLPFVSGSGSTVDDALNDAVEKEENTGDSIWSNWDDVGDVFGAFVEGLSNLQQSLGRFPAIFADVFSFLPREYLVVIGIGLSMVVVLRLLGR